MYKEEILSFADQHEIFTTEDVQKALGIGEEQKAKFNVEMKRLCDRGKIYRFRKGIYGVVQDGNRRVSPKAQDFIDFLYVKNGRGYVGGTSLMNKIGLQTVSESPRVVVTGAISRSAHRYGTQIRKSHQDMNPENEKYFKILDCLRDVERYALNREDAYSRICLEIKEQHLDWLKLLALAGRYYKRDVVIQLDQYITRLYA